MRYGIARDHRELLKYSNQVKTRVIFFAHFMITDDRVDLNSISQKIIPYVAPLFCKCGVSSSKKFASQHTKARHWYDMKCKDEGYGCRTSHKKKLYQKNTCIFVSFQAKICICFRLIKINNDIYEFFGKYFSNKFQI